MKIQIKLSLLLIVIFLCNGNVFTQGLPYENEIRTFLENDRLSPTPAGAIVFAGSSSFTMWTNVQDAFPDHTITNRAFGGSTLNDQILYAKNILIPLQPSQIVIYCGENDFAYDENLSATEVSDRFITLFDILRTHLPETRITYVSMKPSPSRWHLAHRFEKANILIEAFIEAQANASFVNIWPEMLYQNSYPDSSLFLEDMLHMNEKGYRLWQQKIEKELH